MSIYPDPHEIQRSIVSLIMYMAGLAMASTPYELLIAATCEVLAIEESGVANAKRHRGAIFSKAGFLITNY